MANLALWIGLRYTGSKRRNQLVSFISLVSMTGLVMGVALLIIVLSVMNGFDRELRERILGVMPQATVYHRTGIEDWPSYIKSFQQHPQVLAAAPFIQLQGLASVGDKVAPLSIYGVDPVLEAKVSRLHEFTGTQSLAVIPEGGLLLGAGVVRELGARIGDPITIIVPNRDDVVRMPQLGTFVLAGVVESGTEVDNGLGITNLLDAVPLSEFFDGSVAPQNNYVYKVTGIRLKLSDLFSSRQVIRDLMQDLSYGFYGSDWTRTHGNLFQAVQMSRQLVGLLLFLIIAIAAFNVVSTLVMVVVDKQSQIAILRSLGASRWHIMGIFMVQGAMIGVIGTTVGLLIGVLGANTVTGFVSGLESFFNIQFLASDVYPISYLPSDFRAGDCIRVGLISLLMSLLATLYPAWRASRVAPAEALQLDH